MNSAAGDFSAATRAFGALLQRGHGVLGAVAPVLLVIAMVYWMYGSLNWYEGCPAVGRCAESNRISGLGHFLVASGLVLFLIFFTVAAAFWSGVGQGYRRWWQRRPPMERAGQRASFEHGLHALLVARFLLILGLLFLLLFVVFGIVLMGMLAMAASGNLVREWRDMSVHFVVGVPVLLASGTFMVVFGRRLRGRAQGRLRPLLDVGEMPEDISSDARGPLPPPSYTYERYKG